eukprot:CAMPEP_0115042976 /NCGR_PEP_ID=MMETSP0216-20121206/46588_1 /TAXON_ID=223996 /ORGANISM="Protocruzia adherens, Strain Boccale" /LENGTH=232 /DNA_ID=CAMNT_0002425197 /DNA_START=27 /DNA_END=725 /DNA_ORIENTATION=+
MGDHFDFKEHAQEASKLGLDEKMTILARRILDLKCYTAFCIFQTIVSSVVLLMLFSKEFQNHKITIGLEIFIATCIFTEVVLEFASRGKMFFRVWFMWLDLVILIASVFIITHELEKSDGTESPEEKKMSILEFVILGVRYAIQVTRMIRLIAKATESLQDEEDQRISLRKWEEHTQGYGSMDEDRYDITPGYSRGRMSHKSHRGIPSLEDSSPYVGSRALRLEDDSPIRRA